MYQHRVPGYSPAVSGLLEADEEVTIFFGAGISPNNGISVGLQEEAVKISERIMSLSLSLRNGDDLCFVSRADGQIYEYFAQECVVPMQSRNHTGGHA
jgi:hypothetical protein